MKTLSVTLAIMLAVASADVSHLASRYLPPNYHLQNNHHNGMMMMQHKQNPSNERVETIIEKHEVIELPTQIEIVKEGQPIYGVHQQPIEMARMSINNNNNGGRMSETSEIQDLQPPQIPYEMPMREYLPPVKQAATITTVMPPTTTDSPMISSFSDGGETTTEQQLTQEEINSNNYTMTTEMPTQEPAYETTTSIPYIMPENHYLPPMNMPQNNYLPPTAAMSMSIMLPPPEPMPQLNYQQYQEQMMLEQQMQQMYRAQEMMNAIAEIEQHQMITLEQQQQQQQQQPMQPIAPVEPVHVLSDDGYHYKTAADDVRRFRYRH